MLDNLDKTLEALETIDEIAIVNAKLKPTIHFSSSRFVVGHPRGF
jgi:hypothetical protein